MTRQHRTRAQQPESSRRTVTIVAPSVDQLAAGLADPRDMFRPSRTDVTPVHRVGGRLLTDVDRVDAGG